MTVCTNCGSEIDPETCHCGMATADHGVGEGHSPVPMGCTCHLEKLYEVWGWDGMSKFDACFSVYANSPIEAARIFMKTYPFNKRFWEPHKLHVAEKDDPYLTIFAVTSLEPLELHVQ